MLPPHQAPRFYPIVDNLEDLSAMLALGFRWIQLRNKQADRQFYRAARQLLKKSRRTDFQKVILNDDALAAMEFHFDGVHLGQADLAKASPYLSQLRDRNALIGISTHNESELDLAIRIYPSYIALGCLFPSNSKSTLATKTVDERNSLIHKFQSLWTGPRVAIGGVNATHATSLFDAGFTTVAFIKLAQTILQYQLTPQKLWQHCVGA